MTAIMKQVCITILFLFANASSLFPFSANPGNGKSANARKKLSKVKDDSPKGRVSGRGRRPGVKVTERARMRERSCRK